MTNGAKRALIAIGVIVAGGLVFRGVRGGSVEAEVAAAAEDTLTVTIPVEGVTRARDLYTVTAPVTGRLARLDIDAGDVVSAGDTLGRIFPTREDVRTLAGARAEVQAARAAREEAESRVREAELQATQAEREVERRRPLAEMGAISAEAMEQVELAAVAADQRLNAARAALATAEASLQAAESRLLGAESGEQAAAPALPLTAPVGGRVLRLANPSERVVSAGEPLLDLADTGGLEIVLDVLSQDAVLIEPGQKLRITEWGGEEPLIGSIRTVTGAGYTEVSALGVEEQRVDVYADLDHVPASLGTGYRVAGEVVVWHGRNVLRVPTSALFRADEAWQLFVVEDGRARRRSVVLGRRNDQAAQVIEGLEAGEEVILFPSEAIEDGVRVRVPGAEGD